MTDSTDNARGPERIWIDRYNYWANPTHKDEKIEYIRADLAPDPQLIQRQGLVTPEGSNADEWYLFITEHAPEFAAVQIAERFDEITALRARLEAVDAQLQEQHRVRKAWAERAERAEAAPATARRDALMEAAGIAWSDEEDRPWEHWGEHRNIVTAQTVAKEIATAIRALANEAET